MKIGRLQRMWSIRNTHWGKGYSLAKARKNCDIEKVKNQHIHPNIKSTCNISNCHTQGYNPNNPYHET
jgi:hypothetical protein